MRALWRDHVVAESPDDRIVMIEGNRYFPPDTLDRSLFHASPTPYTCHWKGEAQYWTLRHSQGDVHDEAVDAAWSYPTPPHSAIDRVGADFSGYVAFGEDVRVVA
ncbi:DUF427 domain-containing protein [Microbacterium sp. JZ31]|uniref:DUF427 domain-containing protein n=1 Tax=Microbacterium sp. JZ31 TaxID=1906274 RepID=UPI0019323276|nr:DUF427 domain-containing protein [Microbacterium sp. JZ31]